MIAAAGAAIRVICRPQAVLAEGRVVGGVGGREPVRTRPLPGVVFYARQEHCSVKNERC
jgi:hypothetical protein